MAEEKDIFKQLFEQEEPFTEKQQKIVEAAIEMFAEKGYASTSTSQIAKKAGVAEGTIFRHYKTKKDLLLSIVSPTMAKLIAPFVIRDINKVLDARYERYEDFLKAMILNRQEFLKDNMTVFKILIQEIPFHPELKEQFKEHIARKIFEKFTALVDHYKEKGQIIDLPSPAVVRFSATSIFGLLLVRYVFLPEEDWDDEKEIEMTVQMIMNGVGKE
ncbi:TetR family transcriptional regulator [[Bacillus] enclensis]|uniref:Transcriptional regulator, TetR family n=1 Tax=[Bacillus] enclensis TaxID=1402860 RepID=A0A0V8HDD4_9BACI|nr:TetR/AcrR family transcriptional regulator [[Bacillus] enclensis]KSU60569.1 TetR family transcriptional regulator [[Bacillus] enclensis]SCC26267.1 transcriptional regulator, TetR family [[Bacillus] enclensis]